MSHDEICTADLKEETECPRQKVADHFKHFFDNRGFRLCAREKRANNFVPHVFSETDRDLNERIAALESNLAAFYLSANSTTE
ncbi:MAG: hypothetical protein FD149_1113 [Rhodospirillaceae bacterium]|nr:MAG: hypothetical protein FD149_1113 [Rhodospirillaceae bacterium]